MAASEIRQKQTANFVTFTGEILNEKLNFFAWCWLPLAMIGTVSLKETDKTESG